VMFCSSFLNMYQEDGDTEAIWTIDSGEETGGEDEWRFDDDDEWVPPDRIIQELVEEQAR
jgi:hypothetical protein